MARQRTRTTTGSEQSTGRDTDQLAGPESATSRTGASSMQDIQASGVAGEGTTTQAKEKARELASDAKEKAADTVRSGVASGKSRAADTIGSVAQSLLLSSQHLRDRGQQGASRVVERAATRVDRFADYLQNTSPGEMANRVERFARREPALFLGGLFAAGFIGARFLKSSRRDQHDAEWRSLGSRSWQGGTEHERPYAGGYASPTNVADREVPIQRAGTGADISTSPGSTAPGATARGASPFMESETVVERRIIPVDESGLAPNTDFPAVPEDPARREPI